MKFQGWAAVCERLRTVGETPSEWINQGQCNSLLALTERLPQHGCIIADEVGMGKTRIAVALAKAVVDCGGRVVVTIPTGLGAQWIKELQDGGAAVPPVLRSLGQLYSSWRSPQSIDSAPWAQEKILLVSHTFANWRFGESTGIRRWGLLSALYAEWCKHTQNSYPRGFSALKTDLKKEKCSWMLSAAQNIWKGFTTRQKKAMEKHYGALLWNKLRNDPKGYCAEPEARKALDCTVGAALGEFQLLIIDEAHKARGESSGLSRLLNTLFVFAKDARKVGMTATPVELARDDWADILGRIGLDDNGSIEATINAYCESLHALHDRWRTSDQARNEFIAQAKNFKAALSPYVLRRGKREDPAVQLFMKKNKDAALSYRRVRQIAVTTDSLSLPWKEAVCAAEALSHTLRLCEDSTLKRARLTMGSGHSIAAFMDSVLISPDDDRNEADDFQPSSAETNGKRLARAHWWKARLMAPCDSKKDALFAYPTIQEAVKNIESITQSNNKVLVFGKFTKPMRAVTALLNAREMLRCLKAEIFWPQSSIHDELKPAVEFVLRQPGYSDWEKNMTRVEETLAEQYDKRRNVIRRFQNHALNKIDAGLQACEEATRSDPTLNLVLLKPALDSLQQIVAKRRDSDDEAALYPLLCHAMREILGQNEDWNDRPDIEYARAFSEIIHAMTVPDDWDKNGDGKLDAEEAEQALWPIVHAGLRENYGTRQGEFARFMYGNTSHTARRFLQVAFNRPQSYPRVLVAQSLVGREGLNLHTACRHVFLLHPEWNPGAVEQQVGRVDRVGSLWAKTIQSGKDYECTINVDALVFENTYDEHNWQVLLRRWDDHRAQLHGEVIPPRQITKEDRQLYGKALTDLAQCAPNFSPLRRTKS